MPHVPTSFDYHAKEPAEMLERSEGVGLVQVRWPLLALGLVHTLSKDDWFGPDLADVQSKTPGFRQHGLYGFSLGQYTEIMVVHDFGQSPAAAAIRMGGIELTLGETTPLMRYLFDPIHDRDLHGEWEFIRSLRLWMCPPDLAEAYILEGHAALTSQYGLLLSLHPLFEFEYPDQDEDNSPRLIEGDLPAAVLDIEPLRLFHHGYTQRDDGTAILQFYRVLEYYSIVSRHGEVDALRRRTDLTSKQFTLEVAKIVGDEERASICRLVAAIANAAILNQALDDKLIERPEPHMLGSRLCDFRNSIVHAKHDHRAQMFVPTIFQEPPELAKWRRAVQKLARAAIDALGTRRL